MAKKKGAQIGSKTLATQYVLRIMEQGFHVSKRGNVMSSGGLEVEEVLSRYGEALQGVKREEYLNLT